MKTQKFNNFRYVQEFYFDKAITLEEMKKRSADWEDDLWTPWADNNIKGVEITAMAWFESVKPGEERAKNTKEN